MATREDTQEAHSLVVEGGKLCTLVNKGKLTVPSTGLPHEMKGFHPFKCLQSAEHLFYTG